MKKYLFTGLEPKTNLGIGSGISSISLSLCNSQKSFASSQDMSELCHLLNSVRPYLDDMTSFKIILLLLLTESEYR